MMQTLAGRPKKNFTARLPTAFEKNQIPANRRSRIGESADGNVAPRPGVGRAFTTVTTVGTLVGTRQGKRGQHSAETAGTGGTELLMHQGACACWITYEPGGRGFKSCRARQIPSSHQAVAACAAAAFCLSATIAGLLRDPSWHAFSATSMRLESSAAFLRVREMERWGVFGVRSFPL
jgi:hypothetical protein